MMLMFHDDDCEELLDADGKCPKCCFHPDMRSTGFRNVPEVFVSEEVKNGKTFLGHHRMRIQSQAAITVSVQPLDGSIGELIDLKDFEARLGWELVPKPWIVCKK